MEPIDVHFVLQNVFHAPLLKRYDMKTKKHRTVGSAGLYGRVDEDTGAAYTSLGTASTKKPGSVTHCSSELPGPFYPETIVILGYGPNHETLTFEQMEAFAKKLHFSVPQRILTPKGYVKGEGTWLQGLKYLPDCRPQWYGLEKEMHKKFPGGQVYRSGSSIEAYFDGATFDGGEFKYKAIGKP